jgi:hypothetical protein
MLREALQKHDAEFGPPQEWRPPEPQGGPVLKSAEALEVVRKTNENALHEAPAAYETFFDDPAREELFYDTMGWTISKIERDALGRERDLRNELWGAIKQISQTAVKGPQGERGPPGYMPTVVPWRRGSVMYSGMMVYHRGSTWQASRDTAQEPGLKARDWQPVAIAGESGLQGRVEIERGLIERQRSEIARLEAQIAALEQRISALERA